MKFVCQILLAITLLTSKQAYALTCSHLFDSQFDDVISFLRENKLSSETDRNSQGENALLLAVKMKRFDIIRPLLTLGSDINEKNTLGDSALTLAIRDYEPIVKRLVDRNNVNTAVSKGETPFSLAVKLNKVNLVRYFLEIGANADFKDSRGKTLLAYAIENNLREVASVLKLHELKKKPGIDLTSPYKDLMTLTLNHINGQSNAGFSSLSSDQIQRAEDALKISTFTGISEIEIVLRLAKSAAELNSDGMWNVNDLARAAAKLRLPKTIKYDNFIYELIYAAEEKAAKADPSGTLDKYLKERNSQNLSAALSDAIFYGKADIVGLILKAGLDPNSQDRDGSRWLTVAVYSRDSRAVQKLVDAGADVNAVDSRGETALFQAVRNRDIQTIKVLMKANARTDIPDKLRGDTVINVALNLQRLASKPEDIEQIQSVLSLLNSNVLLLRRNPKN